MNFKIVGWILWCIVGWLTLSFSYGCRRAIKGGKNFHIATGVQTFLWLLIVIIFLFTNWNKLHILWLIPVVFLGSSFILQIPILRRIVLFISFFYLAILLTGYYIKIDGYLVKRNEELEAIKRKKWGLKQNE